MERSLLKEMTQKSLDAYIKQSPFRVMLYPQFFDLRAVPSLSWETLRSDQGPSVMADVVAYNSSANLKNREVISKATGDIPKISVKRKMDEKTYNDYLMMRAQATGTNNQAIIDYVFGDVDFCVNAVNARIEYLAHQALSRGGFLLDDANNSGLQYNVSAGVPASNKKVVTAIWSDATNAVPLDDITAVRDEADDSGYNLSTILMERDVFNRMRNTDQVKSVYSGYANLINAVAPNQTQLNEYLLSEGLPQIVIVNQKLRVEDRDGNRTVLSPWQSNNITYVVTLKVGQIQYGPIAEEIAATPNAIKTKVGPQLVMKFSELEPFGEFTKSQANAIPVFSDPYSLWIQNTQSTTDFE